MRQTQLQLGVPLANLPDRGNYTKARAWLSRAPALP
jgi:hypothetical protein